MKMSKSAAIFMALGFELVGLVLGLVYAGSIIDEKYQLGGFGVAGGAVIALIVWLIHLTRAAKILEKEN